MDRQDFNIIFPAGSLAAQPDIPLEYDGGR